MCWAVVLQLDGSHSLLSPVVHGYTTLAINTQYNTSIIGFAIAANTKATVI